MPKPDDLSSSSESTPAKIGRRTFLVSAAKFTGQMALANTAIYSVSLFEKGGKFGGLTAGAKCTPPQIAVGPYCCDSVVWDPWFGWVCE